MTHKLIKTDNYLLVVDDSEIKVGYYITDKYRVWQWEDDSSLLGRHKIIAHLPLNGSRILESLPLLPSGIELIFETIGGKFGLESIDEHDQVDGYFDTYKEAELALFKNITKFETEDVLTPSQIFYPNDVPYSSPKTITTDQGIQWVGKYK
jgi:hypothetical protein